MAMPPRDMPLSTQFDLSRYSSVSTTPPRHRFPPSHKSHSSRGQLSPYSVITYLLPGHHLVPRSCPLVFRSPSPLRVQKFAPPSHSSRPCFGRGHLGLVVDPRLPEPSTGHGSRPMAF